MIALPRNWTLATVDDTGEYINGMAFKPSDWQGEGLPIIRIQNLTDREKEINRTRKRVEDRYIVEDGELLVSWSATLDAFLWDRGRAVLNQHIFKVVPETRLVEKRFLYHGLRTKIREMIAGEHMHGSTMRHINRGPFLAHPFEIPPLPEQRRIVAKIDNLFAKSKRADEHLGHVRRLVDKYKDAILAAAFRGGLSETNSGQSVRPWKKVSPKTLFEWSSGKNLPSKSQARGNVPVIGGNGIGGYHDTPLINFPTLVIGRVGAQCGNVHRSDGPAWITDNAIYAKSISNDVNLDFAVIFFRMSNLNALAGGTGQPYVNHETLNSLRMPLPELDEQRKIVQRVDKAMAWIGRLASEATSARRLIDQLNQAVLAKAFRGELVSQDPGDEPASILLERIRAERTKAPSNFKNGPKILKKSQRGK